MQTRHTETWTDADWDQYGIVNPNIPSNLSIVLDMLDETQGINGDIVECGVFQGSSLAVIAYKLKLMNNTKALWGFDSFEGLPEPTEEDKLNGSIHPKAKKGYFGQTSLDVVRNKLGLIGYKGGPVHLVPGFFHETLHAAPSPISLLFLDCDLYESYRTCLTELWPKVSPGGIIIFDEYFSLKYPGARKAVDEFFASKLDKPQMAQKYCAYSIFERWFVTKTANR